MSDQEQKFSDWLDGMPSKKAGPDAKDSESAKDSPDAKYSASAEEIAAKETWQERAAVAKSLFHQVSLQEDREVPQWDRGSAFITKENKPWWQWSGLPVMSMACSFIAIALVLLKVELVMQPEGVLLSFSGSHSKSNQAQQEAKVNRLVNQKLREFASEQQVILANYATDIITRQQDNNLQLASYILDASRQERKEDISDFIGYVNEQRKDEKLDQKIKYQQLEHKIKLQKISTTTSAVKAKPASWRLEE